MSWYDGKMFAAVENSASGDVTGETCFSYHQDGDLVWATYGGGTIRFGTLIAKADEDGVLDMRYQHLTLDGELKTGFGRSVPERLADGRVRLHETWQWTSGDRSSGTSVVEEVPE